MCQEELGPRAAALEYRNNAFIVLCLRRDNSRNPYLWNNLPMKSPIQCSFCGKPEDKVSGLVAWRRTSASICDACLEVCRKILVKSGTEPIVDAPKSHYRVKAQAPERKQLSCSFCGTSQEKAHRLIGSPRDLQPAYICDKCVARGDAAIEGRDTASLGSWIARKLGRRDTTIHHLG
jgi:ribosomal protein L24E